MESNELTGCIPTGLGDVPSGDLHTLGLRLCGSTGQPQAPTDTPASFDRAALAALYDATDGANWRSKDNWLSDAPLDEWYGVTTDDSGRVTVLSLRDNNLRGEIPAEVGGLLNLERLWTGGSNRLTGCLPKTLQDIPGGDLHSLGMQPCGAAGQSDPTAGTPASDMAALFALYDATGGESWDHSTNWLSGAPLGQWPGSAPTTARALLHYISGAST